MPNPPPPLTRAPIYKVGDEFLSNDGEGPLLAKITAIQGANVWMESRRLPSGKRITRFELKAKFFASPHCGWKRVKP